MKFHTVAKQFSVTAIALTLAVGCASNAKKEDEAKAAADAAQTEAQAAEQQAASDLAAQQAAAEAAAAEAAAKAEAERQARLQANSSDYTVVSGDSLWSIAGQGGTYGNPYAWPLIYKANKSKINDADLIFPGQSFVITSASSAEMNAAVQHAKTRGAWSVGAVEASDSEFLAQ
jgi:nucleoid-associated protein YgaU